MQCFKSAILLKGRQLQISQYFERPIFVSSSIHSKHTTKLVNRFFLKNDVKKKKKKWHDPSMPLNTVELAQPQVKGVKSSHRFNVLNKVFMDKICDILSTGNVSSLFSGYGLEISKVCVTPGMSSVNVHWFCTGSSIDEEIETLLVANTRMLREELSQQRILGHIPPIQFVKDRRYYRFKEVEKRLAIADYGEDFDPTQPSHYLKSATISEIGMELSPKLKEALNIPEEHTEIDIFENALELSGQLNEVQESVELPKDLPTMRHDVLGVDTQKIYTLVRQCITRKRAEHRKSSYESPLALDTYSLNTDNPLNIATRTEEIRKWASIYEQQRKNKRRKRSRETISVSRPYVEESFDEVLYEEEEDYIDEESELDSPLKP